MRSRGRKSRAVLSHLFALSFVLAMAPACSDGDDTPPGQSGSSGAAGNGGTAGTSGGAGHGGAAANGAGGAGGVGGVGGTVSTGGASGSAGTSGTAGTAGSSGTGGSAGRGGTAGDAGSAGTSAGSSGGSGTAGSAGSAGSAGTSAPGGSWTDEWHVVAGDDNVQQIDRVSADPGGNVALSVAFRGSLDLGGGPISDAGTQGPAYVIARLDSTGHHVFSRRLINTSDMGVTGVASGTDGSVLVTGWFTGSIDLGAGAVVTTLSQDSFVAMYSPMGALSWSKILGDSSVSGSSVHAAGAVFSQGEIVVAGTATGRVKLGTNVDIPGGAAALFFGRFTTAGAAIAAGSAVFPEAHGQPYAVSARPGGGAVVAGQFLGTFKVGGATYTSQPGSDIQDFADAYVVAVDSTLAVSWSHDFRQDSRSTEPTAVAVASDGTTWVVGSTSYATPSDDYDFDAIVATFDASGTPTWNQRFGYADSAQQALGVVTEPDGSAVVVGSFDEAVGLPGGSTLHATGDTDGFVLRIAHDHTVVNAWALGDAAAQSVTCVDRTSDGSLVLGGGFSGTMTLGNATLSAGADEDLFVAYGAFGD